MSFYKFLYSTLTILPLLLGIGLLSTGLIGMSWYGNICSDRLVISIPKVGIIMGSLYMGIVLFGYVSLYTTKSYLGCLYTTLSIVFIVAISGCLIYTVIVRKQVIDITERCLLEAVHSYDRTKHGKQFIDTIQQKFECCGSKNFRDYYSYIPDSCCKSKSNCYAQSADLYPIGCFELFKKRYNYFFPIAIAIIGTITSLMVFANICACFVFFGRKRIVYEKL